MTATIEDANITKQVVLTDATGNRVTVTGGKLDVNATVSPSAGGATEAKQDTQITAEQAILAKIIAAPATEAKQDTAIASLVELTSAPVEKTPVKVVKVVTNTADPAVPLVAGATVVRVCQLQAKKVAGDNTGNIFVGLADLDQGASELFELTPGATQEIPIPPGTSVDLANIYIDADNNGDGVVGWYTPV